MINDDLFGHTRASTVMPPRHHNLNPIRYLYTTGRDCVDRVVLSSLILFMRLSAEPNHRNNAQRDLLQLSVFYPEVPVSMAGLKDPEDNDRFWRGRR
jgi:hypothetical protein